VWLGEGCGRNILLWCGSLDFEGDRLMGRVGQAQDLGDLVGERAWRARDMSAGEWQAGCMETVRGTYA
jgi:hypothetical protein